MSNSPAFPYPYYIYAPPPPPPPSPSTGLGLGFGIVGLIAVMLAFKYICKAIPAGTEPLGHQGGSHAAASATHQQRWSPRRPSDDGEQQLQGASLDDRPRLPDPTPSLPAAFAYNRSLQRKVKDTAGEEAAACAVCLGTFEFGDMVRLLPVCLHLYHAECIDQWLRKNSTCPVCRSETDPMMVMDVSQLPPV
ncbi:hypothetical protein PAHAL_4G121700 [Panicum hallii]|uniref:RING-type E3 ubiquitin transferase n=1 Tax=Panicum hallii TaxID=206008 RepID=A0A2S3HIV6_9POAL|nr:RING-H2 finger protein ATL46-like [Panicum hallii]PAN23831.1 hypothetical protein PAHAL_4G121700 [Panicum hallii]